MLWEEAMGRGDEAAARGRLGPVCGTCPRIDGEGACQDAGSGFYTVHVGRDHFACWRHPENQGRVVQGQREARLSRGQRLGRLEARRLPDVRAPAPGVRVACLLCGRRVSVLQAYVRHAGPWMFPYGMIPDEGAGFSPVHRECAERAGIEPEYIFTREERDYLESEA